MMIISIRPWTKGLILAIATWLMVSCNGDRKEAAATAKTFLQAYYTDLDFDKAVSLSSAVSYSAIKEHAEMVSLNPYAKEETPDIAFVKLTIDKNNPDFATYTYTCNRVEKTLPLHRLNGKWVIDLNGSSVEAYGSTDNFVELSTSSQGGFTAASSGEIKYKKRR